MSGLFPQDTNFVDVGNGLQIRMPGGTVNTSGTSPAGVLDSLLNGIGSYLGIGGNNNSSDSSFFGNNGWFGTGLDLLKTGVGIYGGLQALNLQKKALNEAIRTNQANRQIAGTELNNAISSYNTKLQDTATARYANQYGSGSQADAAASEYYNKNKLSDFRW